MKQIIALSILSLITTGNLVSKSNVRRGVSSKVIYKKFGVASDSFKKKGRGF